MPTIAEQMSSWTVALHYSHLPAEVAHLAKRMIVDTIGCAIGAYTSEPSKIARDLALGLTPVKSGVSGPSDSSNSGRLLDV
jgi:2-methylcitrate dehydratase PrpD